MTKRRKPYKKIALTFSICMMLLWAMLGTGASLAWFVDTSSELKNIFHTAEFDLVVSYKDAFGQYREIDSTTSIFDENALYEPGYVQVVYLKVENRGSVPFDYRTAVGVSDYTPATNAFGWTFQLQDYLRFGVVTADTEPELLALLADRSMAVGQAQMPLNNYTTDMAALEAGGEDYMALIVRMPEEVGNEANYRGDTVPRVELGLIVRATQQGMP